MSADVVRGTATPLARVGAVLGEGPVWLADDAALWFVDIKGRRVHRLDPASGRLDGWDAPDQVGWVLPASDGGLVAGLPGGLHRFDPARDSWTPYRSLDDEPATNRLNDAAVDPFGRLWFGSMDDGEAAATGRLYRHDAGGIADSGVAPVVITNGPAFAPAGRSLYTVDTLGRRIDVHPVGADGTLGEARRFLDVHPSLGHPDGAICDAEGGVWIAFFGGWAARRYSPDGVLTHEISFPVANVTKIAIGGPDGRTAYATTARKGLDAAALAAQPHAGDVFSFPVDVPGVPVRPVLVG